VKGLVKHYGSGRAVDGVDLEIKEGEIFALLGPNGAGKTTTVEILEGFRTRDAGDVLVLGRDPADGDPELKREVGIVLQSTGMDPYLTVEETIDLFGSYYPHPLPTDEVLRLVGLTEKRNVRVTKLSGGQQRRLDVGIALAGDPKLLFLDEPTTGFDPGARRNAWEVVKGLAALGKTILLTTHYMDEAQYLADRVAIIANGRILVEGPPSTLAGRDLGSSIVRFKLPEGAQLPAEVMAAAAEVNGYLEFKIPNPTHFLHDLTGWALQNKVTLESLEVKRPSLEDIYLKLTEHAQPAEVVE
ncbi:MAG: ABC transporter ATP-binding protein, partial [Actinomycetota bacterium]